MKRNIPHILAGVAAALAGAWLWLPGDLLHGAARPRVASVLSAEDPVPLPGDLVAGFDVARAMGHVHHLAQRIGPRPTGSPRERQAADYIAGKMRAEGWEVEVQEGIRVPGTALVTRNVTGIHPAPGGEWVVIAGAHYDSSALGEASPGANDNASGVAVLLEAARLLRDTRLPYELRLVFFGGEERPRENPGVHHVGSGAYVRGLGEAERGRVAAMISVDMVGAGPELTASRVGYGPDLARQWLLASAGRLGLDLRTDTGKTWSDHAPFERAGIPAVWLTRMGGDPHWHTSRDTPCRIGALALTEAGRLTVRFLLTAGEKLGRPQEE